LPAKAISATPSPASLTPTEHTQSLPPFKCSNIFL
jgi:hypothetical protein